MTKTAKPNAGLNAGQGIPEGWSEPALAARPFRDTLLETFPELRERVEAQGPKRRLALALRALRTAQGLTQKEIEARSGLSQPVVSRLEAPTGSLPNWETVRRYVAACGGHMTLSFTAGEADEIVSAVAL